MRSNQGKGAIGAGKTGSFGGHHGVDQGSSTVTTTALTTANDTLTGGTGRDVFTATSTTFNAGDSLDGGAGYDVLKLSDAGTFNLNSLAGFSNFEEIQGTSTANQTITLRDGADLRLVAGNGTNVITTGATGNQQIELGTGTNTVTAQGGTTSVTTHGGTSTITGGTGLLTVRADGGTTTITAGTGGSHVDLGYGTVSLTGGSGTDTIDVGHGRGSITVTGFTQGTDKVDVHALHFASYDALLAAATVTTSGSDTTITFDLGPTITLTGVSAVTSSDFTL